MSVIQIPFLCDWLIDQGQYIGSDPVGRACLRPAKQYGLFGEMICASCFDGITNEPHRYTLNGYLTKEEKEEYYRDIMKQTEERIGKLADEAKAKGFK